MQYQARKEPRSMKEVILTVGPQGAGKTTFCKKIVKAHPEIAYVSRDEVLTEMFGKTSLNPYTGGHIVAFERMLDIVAEQLDQPNARMILDCWNGFPGERVAITQRLRFFGADRVEAWRFVTPEETCIKWFMDREEATVPDKSTDERWRQLRRDMAIDSCRSNYALYHRQPVELDQGFNFITCIDPSSQKLPPFADLFWPVKLDNRIPLRT